MAGQAAADGTPFGRYRLVELLGGGGMGDVWRAYDTATDRIVAIKVLHPHLSDDEEFQRRFRLEAHAAARLNNPHVIPIHNYGEIDGRLYVDMRLVEGRDLGAVLADGPLEPGRAVRIIEQVANALHAAHQVGLLHRDVKPSNILLDRDDFAYLIDFGIARALDETRITKSGSTIGTRGVPMILLRPRGIRPRLARRPAVHPVRISLDRVVTRALGDYAISAPANFLLAGRDKHETEIALGELSCAQVHDPVRGVEFVGVGIEFVSGYPHCRDGARQSHHVGDSGAGCV